MSVYYLSADAKKEKLAYNALAEIPKLIVDPVMRKLTLLDQRVPVIMINGVVKPNALDVLDSSMIESVELVENPPARYRANNTSAILNIKVRKNGIRPYVNGNVSINEMPTFTHGVEVVSAELGTAKSSLSLRAMHFYNNRVKWESYSDITSSNLRRITETKSKNSTNMLYLNLFGDKAFSSKDYLAVSVNSIIHPEKTISESTGTIEQTASGNLTDMTGSYNSKSRYSIRARPGKRPIWRMTFLSTRSFGHFNFSCH